MNIRNWVFTSKQRMVPFGIALFCLVLVAASQNGKVVEKTEKDEVGVSVDTLIESLGSNDKDIQSEARRSLCHMGDEADIIIPKLLRIFHEGSVALSTNYEKALWKRHYAIFDALIILGRNRIELLLHSAKSIELNNRKDMICLFRLIGDTRAIPFIIESAKSDNPKVREEALTAISWMRDARGFETVMNALNDSNESVQLQAIRVVSSLPDQRFLPHLRNLYAKKTSQEYQKAIISSLGTLQASEFVEEFIRLYRATPREEDTFRGIIAVALGELRDPRALEILSEYYLDHSNFVDPHQQLVGMALLKIPDLRNSEAPFRVWKDEKADKEVRLFSAMIVAQSCNPQAMDAVEYLLKHGNDDLKTEAIRVLRSKVDGTKAASLLRCASEDQSEYIRVLAKKEIESVRYIDTSNAVNVILFEKTNPAPSGSGEK